ncbi:MAG TPA: ribosome maturation factor RimM [Terracidiphilus sp.]
MPEPTQSWVWLARIRRPQGRKGEVFAEILTDFPEKFKERRQLWLLPSQDAKTASSAPRLPANASASSFPREIELTNHWLHKGGIVLHFAGVDSISAAEELKGIIVAIPRAERAALNDDEIYVGDLIGCALVDTAGAEPVTVGDIEDVDKSGGAAPLLVVRGVKGEVLIPFAKSYLRRIDLAAKRVEMELPVGLVDLSEADEA